MVFFFLIVVTVFGIITWSLNKSIESKSTEQRFIADSLQNYKIAFNDLENSSLIKNLKEKKLVLLGEQQHGDGATQALNSELVIFLKKNGFNVLFFESNFYPTYRLNESLRNAQNIDFSVALNPFWAKSKETKELRQHIYQSAKTSDPFIVRGIDFQIPTIFTQKKIYEDLVRYLNTIPSFEQYHYRHFWHSLKNGYGPVLYFNSKSSKMDKNREACLREIKLLIDLINSDFTSTNGEQQLYIRYLQNIYDFYYAKMFLKGDKYNAYRDSVMFENTIFQMEQFPDEKFVLWSANKHILNTNKFGKNLGYYLKNKFKDEMFTIMTTSYDGYSTNIATSNIQRNNPATSTTVEYFLKNNHPDASIFYTNNALKNKSSVMRFLGFNNLENFWFKEFDAFIFIPHMTPTHY